MAQDTTSLNYAAHPATTGLGPINARADAAQGLKLHDSLAVPRASFARTAEVKALCPDTRLVNIADREADIYALFQAAHGSPAGVDLRVRASRTTQRQVNADDETQPLWDYLPSRPVLGGSLLPIPAPGGRKARTVRLALRGAPSQLRPSKRLKGALPLALWAVHAIEPDPPAEGELVEWLLLTTMPTTTQDDALERLRWYAAR